MQIDTLKTAAQADKYFDAERLAHGSFAVYGFTRVSGEAHSVAFTVRFCGQESSLQMTPGVLDYLVNTFGNAAHNAERFAGRGPEEVVMRGMDRLLPVFMAVQDQMKKCDKVSEQPAAPAAQTFMPFKAQQREGFMPIIRA